MKRSILYICVASYLSYAVGVIVWFVLYRASGDEVWWLALVNVFAPYLFVPLAVLIPVSVICSWRILWVSVALPAALFMILYGSFYLPSRPPAIAEDGSTLTVMTFNAWVGSKTAETARIILDHGPPDIVALQELTPRLSRWLLEELGDIYPYHTLDARRGLWGMGVMSRYPLAELEISSPVLRRWQIQAVQIKGNGGEFTLYNVHMPSTQIPLYASKISNIPERVRSSFAQRELYAEQLVQELASRSGPTMVAGDLNCTDRSEVYALLTRSLTDVHRAVGWGLGHTFPSRWDSYRGIPYPARVVRIDMILASPSFVPLRSYVGASGGESDHLPFVAKFSWPMGVTVR